MKKTAILTILALVLTLLLAGCGDSAPAQFSDIEAKPPADLDSVTIDGSDYGFSDIETVPAPELGSTEIDGSDYGFSDIETAPAPELGSTEIDGSDYGFSDIETAPAPELGTTTIEAPTYDFGDIEAILPSGNLTYELKMPDYDFKEITVQGVTLSIPQIDYEISFDKIGSAYTDTYTLPNVQIDVPQFDDPALAGAYLSIADNLTLDGQYQLAEMSEAEFAQLASVQLSMTDMLFEAFRAANITLAIDPITGSVPIDATLLFDTDKYELKSEGKAALKAFFTVYCSVLEQPEYRDAVGSIIIEGHTDTQGTHEYNQTLSEKRAKAVADFLLSDECGLADRDFLQGLLVIVGRSYDDPVYASDGSVDMDASRRVEIRFTPNLDL